MARKNTTTKLRNEKLELDFSSGQNSPDLLSLIESITWSAEGIRLEFKMMAEKDAITTLADFLSVTRDQAVLFAVITEMSLQQNVTMDMLARFMNCKMVRMMAILDNLEALEQRLLIKRIGGADKRREAFSQLAFTVPKHVLEVLRKADNSLLGKKSAINFPALLDQLKQALNDREDDIISVAQFMHECEDLLEQGKNLPYVHYLNGKLNKTSSKIVTLILILSGLTGKTDNPPENFYEVVFSNLRDQVEFNRLISTGQHELLRSGVLVVSGSGHEGRSLNLGSASQNLLFIDFPELFEQAVPAEGLMLHHKIAKKVLHFDPEINDRISDLERLLGAQEFNRYRERAKMLGVSHGITAIFFGHPGTGKTELALQIARKTRRNLMMVDLSETRSMWFGESEKNVRRIFEQYRDALKTSPTEPILFINEADGLLSRRLDIGKTAQSITHTQNLIQNILLQELEDFNGILIATTNLTGNLDKAFERRFLLKIDFPRPGSGVRQQIWLSKLPELSPEMALTLAERFDFTGGQIENQVRQLLMKRVLNEDLDLFETLLQTCEQETGFTDRKPIGFNG